MKKKEVHQVESLDSEKFILKLFRTTKPSKITYVGNSLKCRRIEILLKWKLFSKSWIDSSENSRPDFHNEKHKLLLEVMCIDDCIGDLNGRLVANYFEKMRKLIHKYFGHNYANLLDGCTLFVNPNTYNDEEFNFNGYIKNFERVLLDHSSNIECYKNNYPNCKSCILFICDLSNAYYQKNPNWNNNPKRVNIVHLCFLDQHFLDIIKKCHAEYVVWFTPYKSVFSTNGRQVNLPVACIYDVRNIRSEGVAYDYKNMLKVK